MSNSPLECLQYIQQNGPLANLFRTEEQRYIYDTGTGKVLECSELEYGILKAILSDIPIKKELEKLRVENSNGEVEEAIYNVYNAIISEDILNVEAEKRFSSPNHLINLSDNINTKLRQVLLEVTEKCNLRCRYCTYEDEFKINRNHGHKDMSLEVAYSALDYLATHGDKEEVYISFYGGEPLLRIDFIKNCVDYVINKIDAKKINFNLTTNLTLMTQEVAEYFNSIPNFIIMGSLDGPEEIHNRYRIDTTGKGSFEKTRIGLKNLLKAFGDDAKNRIILSMVYAPPCSRDKLDAIQNFLDEEGIEGIKVRITYPAEGSVPREDRQKEAEDITLIEWSKERLISSIYNNEVKKPFSQDLLDYYLQSIHQIVVTDKAEFALPLNACCVPGQQRIYVSCDGDINICERILGPYSIGNVYEGVDVNLIKKVYVDDYKMASYPTCSKCWASKLCTQCYATIFTNGEFDLEKRNNCCFVTKSVLNEAFNLYYKIYQFDINQLSYLNHLEVYT